MVGRRPAVARATQFAFAANVSEEDTMSDTHVDMGFAIVNPSTTDIEDADATITATLILEQGGAPSEHQDLHVPVGATTSRFLSELLDDVVRGTRFIGIVRLSSNANTHGCWRSSTSGANPDVYSTVAVQPESTFRYNTYYDLEYNNSLAEAQPITPPVEIIGTLNSAVDGPRPRLLRRPHERRRNLYVTYLANALGSPLEPECCCTTRTDLSCS